MAAVFVYGASSGALHAVTGPDHILSLGPAALRARRRSFSIGLRWGAGHALGTLLLAIPLLLLSAVVHLPSIAAYAERLAGLALLATVAHSLWSARRPARQGGADARSPIVVGFVHGATGAGGLLLLLPVLVSGDPLRTAVFLVAFAISSMIAMAFLTEAIGRLGARLETKLVQRSQQLMLAGSLALGTYWLCS